MATGQLGIRKHRINIWKLSQICSSFESTVAFCKDVGLLPTDVKCPNCKSPLEKITTLKGKRGTPQYRYQCNKRECKKAGVKNTVYLKAGTWFGGSHITLPKSLLMAYCFVYQMDYNATERETSIGSDDSEDESIIKKTKLTSTETISDYRSYCREVCIDVLQTEENDVQIGGEGKIVEIDESLFGKQKDHKGRPVHGKWVFGGICRETKEKFFKIVQARDSATLIPLIEHHIAPGSKIFSDCWKAYDALDNMPEYEHFRVNHTEEFVAEDGTHTQNIECEWWQIKRKLPETHTRHDNLGLYLAEYIWRNSRKGRDLYMAFLQDAGKLYPGTQ